MTQPLFDGVTLLHKKRAADQALIHAEARSRNTVIATFQMSPAGCMPWFPARLRGQRRWKPSRRRRSRWT
jgi:hypothetical protein